MAHSVGDINPANKPGLLLAQRAYLNLVLINEKVAVLLLLIRPAVRRCISKRLPRA